MPHESATHTLRKAVYSTLCLSKGLGAAPAPNCTVKTNTDLFSLVGKTMVNSGGMEPAGDFCFLLFLLLCKCSCSYASLSCGILCDIQYKSEQTLLFLIWWMMENIEIADLFRDVSFSVLSPMQTRWLLFAAMHADRAVVLQNMHFYHMCLSWRCGNPILVTVGVWLSPRDHCDMSRIN